MKALPVTLPETYLAALACRRCSSIRFVHKWAEPHRYWFCHRADDGRRCGTNNTWEWDVWPSPAPNPTLPKETQP